MKSKSEFLSKDGKTIIHYTTWSPDDNNIRGVIQLTHGMTEYMDNYNIIAEFFAHKGFFVIGHDQLGHGHSIQNKNELGYLPKRDSVDILIEDMHTLMKKAKGIHPSIPYFLLGHSFGSFLCRIFASKYGNELNGLILTGTGNESITRIKYGLKVLRALIITKKSSYRSRLVQRHVFLSFNSRIKRPKNRYEWICRDEQSVQDYLNNPLNCFIYTLNGFSTILSSALKMQDDNVYKLTPNNLPILLISGSEDPVGKYSKKVFEVRDLYKSHNQNDVSVKIYEGARHNILLETNKYEVFNEILEWINRKVSF